MSESTDQKTKWELSLIEEQQRKTDLNIIYEIVPVELFPFAAKLTVYDETHIAVCIQEFAFPVIEIYKNRIYVYSGYITYCEQRLRYGDVKSKEEARLMVEKEFEELARLDAVHFGAKSDIDATGELMKALSVILEN